MKSKKIFDNFTKQYQLSKTLRFELVPQYGTENLVRRLFEKPEENHHEIIRKDLELYKSYKQVKKLIDCRHRNIIDDVLGKFKFSDNELQTLRNFGDIENDDTDSNKKDLFDKLRKKISEALLKEAEIMFDSKLLNPGYKNIEGTEDGGKKKCKKKVKGKTDLEIWMNSADKRYLEEIDTVAIVKDIEKMEGFFTYLSGFNENRMNVYSKEKIATAIPYRIVHDNFPIFKSNIENYSRIKNAHPELAKLIDEKGANEIFKLEYVNKCLTQAGIDVYNKDRLGIAAKEQGKEQEKGINQIINEYVQKENKRLKEEKAGNPEKTNKIKVAIFDKLKKQILGISKTKSFQFEVFESTPEIIAAINDRYDFLTKKSRETNLLEEIQRFLCSLSNYDLGEVYLNEKAIGILSKRLFDYGRYIEFALEKWYDDKINRSGNDKRGFLAKKQFSIKLIEDSINNYLENYEQNESLKYKYKGIKHPIVEYFKNPTIAVHLKDGETEKQIEKPLFNELERRRHGIGHILNSSYNKDLKEEKGKDSENVKAFLDALLEINYILSPFFVKDKNLGKEEKDEEFYNERKRLQELIFDADILALYNQTRNYITQKPYKLDKFKLTFGRGYFLSGWSDEIKDKEGFVLIKETKELKKTNKEYYLLIPNEALSDEDKIRLFATDEIQGTKICLYEFQKMDLKNFPRMFINSKGSQKSPAIKKYNLPIETIWDDYQEYRKLNTKGKEKYLSDNPNFRHKLINYFKLCAPHHESLSPFKDLFASVWKKTEEYSTLAEFYKDTLGACYNLKFESANFVVIKEFATSGKLHLFRIQNKDFKTGSTGSKNLHTLYWEMLFDPKNLEDVQFKLNGGAELFYREATPSLLKYNTIHKVGEKVPKKFFKLSDGKLEPVPAQSIKNLNAYYQGKISKDKLNETDLKYIDNYSVIKHKDRIKDNRFTKDKIQFHCSITMNFKPKPQGRKNINDEVLDFLYRNDDVHIIGLDRGERHLIYLTMINKHGKIVDGMQFSLNEMKKIDYQKLLNIKEGNRMEARKNWQEIESIKDLKEGYLSLVVHELAKLVVEKKAIIVLEDLNYGFKDSRAKVEKQIYQKFENKLIKKLQYLVTDKNNNNLHEEGGVLNGYQLSNENIPSYKGMRRQLGFLFYVPPDYTSKLCPVTGFVDLLRPRYSSMKDAIAFLRKFDGIYYDTNNNYFRFDFDYKHFDKLRVDVSELSRTEWSVCSHPATRSVAVQVNNKWVYRPIDINEQLEVLLKGKIEDYKDRQSLKDVICNIDDAKFFEKLLKLLSALLTLRHTYKDEKGVEHDTIVSPVELEKGTNKFFISKTGNDLPANADANGAYNIARKGLWLLNELDKTDDKEVAIRKFNELKGFKDIKKHGDEKPKKVSQWVPNKEWLRFAQTISFTK